MTNKHGMYGQILKSGIINAQDSVKLFSSWIKSNRVISAYDFINTKNLFTSVVGNERFCLLTLGPTSNDYNKAQFAFGLTAPSDIKNIPKIEISGQELEIVNPNDLSVPPAASKKDLALLIKIQKTHGHLRSVDNSYNPWNVHYTQGHLNSSSGSALFKDNMAESIKAQGYNISAFEYYDNDGNIAGEFLPLYEGKYIAQQNHRFGTFEGVSQKRRFGVKAEAQDPDSKLLKDRSYEIVPRYWLKKEDAEFLFDKKGTNLPWLFAFRDVCRAIVDARTIQACVLPRYPCVDGAPLLVFKGSSHNAAFSALIFNVIWTSFVFDYAARQKIHGAHLTKAIAYQLPMPSPHSFDEILFDEKIRDFIKPRGLELTVVTNSLLPIARSLGYDGTPFVWNEERRFLIRSELDTMLFHFYGINRDDVDYIMETFPIVKRKDIQKYGEYHTKLTILKIYDKMKKAMETGKPYQTILDPPPADPRVAHPPADRAYNDIK